MQVLLLKVFLFINNHYYCVILQHFHLVILQRKVDPLKLTFLFVQSTAQTFFARDVTITMMSSDESWREGSN